MATVKQLEAQLAELRAMVASLTTAPAPASSTTDPVVTLDRERTEKYGVAYARVKIAREDSMHREALKAIRYGAQGKGKARWHQSTKDWTIAASALKGTVFAKFAK